MKAGFSVIFLARKAQTFVIPIIVLSDKQQDLMVASTVAKKVNGTSSIKILFKYKWLYIHSRDCHFYSQFNCFVLMMNTKMISLKMSVK